MKYLIIILTIGMLAAGCNKAATPSTDNSTSTQQSTNTDQSDKPATDDSPQTPSSTQKSTTTNTSTKTGTTAQTPSTPAPTNNSSGEKKYTTAEVAAANSESNCLTIVNGSVYNLTSYMTKHPGGKQNILKICGKDGTSAFMSQHGDNSRVNSMLSGFKVGVLAK